MVHTGEFIILISLHTDPLFQSSLPQGNSILGNFSTCKCSTMVFRYPTFTAHPKVCPINHDMIFFGYINGTKRGPWLHYGVVDRYVNILVLKINMKHAILVQSLITCNQFFCCWFQKRHPC